MEFCLVFGVTDREASNYSQYGADGNGYFSSRRQRPHLQVSFVGDRRCHLIRRIASAIHERTPAVNRNSIFSESHVAIACMLRHHSLHAKQLCCPPWYEC